MAERTAELVLANAKLLEEEANFRTLAESTGDGILVAKRDGTHAFVNRRAAAIMGYSCDELLTTHFQQLVAPDQRAALLDRFRRRMTGEVVQGTYETTILRKDGGVVPIELTATPIFWQNARADLVIIRDISARKEAERALAWEVEVNTSLAAMSSALLDSASLNEISALVLKYGKELTGSEYGFVGYIDPDTGFFVNTTLTRDIWDICQVAGKSVVFEKFGGLWGWVLQNRQPLLTNAPADDPRASGTPAGHVPIRRFVAAPALIGDDLVGQVALANAAHDYTPRDLAMVEQMAAAYAIAVQHQRTLLALRASEAKFKTVFSISPAGIMLVNDEDIVVDANPALEKMLGFSCETLRRGEYHDLHFLTSEGMPLMAEDIFTARARANATTIQNVDLGIVKLDGSALWVNVSAAPLNGSGIVLVATDITERKRMEQTLHEERDLVAAILDTAAALIIVLDPAGRVVRFNRACEELTGYRFAEVAGSRFWERLLLPEEARAVSEVFDVLCANQPVRHSQNHWVTKEGHRRLIAWSNAVLYDAQGAVAYIMGTGMDITEHKELEELRVKDMVIAASLSSICIADLHGYITYVNRSFLELWGFPSESEALGQPMNGFIEDRAQI